MPLLSLCLAKGVFAGWASKQIPHQLPIPQTWYVMISSMNLINDSELNRVKISFSVSKTRSANKHLTSNKNTLGWRNFFTSPRRKSRIWLFRGLKTNHNRVCTRLSSTFAIPKAMVLHGAAQAFHLCPNWWPSTNSLWSPETISLRRHASISNSIFISRTLKSNQLNSSIFAVCRIAKDFSSDRGCWFSIPC